MFGFLRVLQALEINLTVPRSPDLMIDNATVAKTLYTLKEILSLQDLATDKNAQKAVKNINRVRD